MNKQLKKNCELHNEVTIVKLTVTGSEKIGLAAFDVSGECGCYLGKIEAELGLNK